ncbi:hypothetical protein AURDEDRAFT_124827 [Auricularia subglabra TFB-10046 SS5]|nr:hypothetical protein AURDEDRAFT_124827 [Auricularia subglabra TFB-10046 SS5]
MPNIFSTLSSSSSTPSLLGSANFADTSTLASSDSASVDSTTSSDGDVRPRTPPNISMEARARINVYLLEHSTQNSQYGRPIHEAHAALGCEPVYTPSAPVSEDDVREAEDVSSNDSLSFVDLPSLVGPGASSVPGASDDDAMSIISCNDIPVEVSRVFVKTKQPGVLNIEYQAVREPGQPLVDGGKDDKADDQQAAHHQRSLSLSRGHLRR